MGLYEALLEIVSEAGLLCNVAADVSSQAELSSVGNENQKIDFDCKGFLARSNVVEYAKLIEKYRSRYKDMSVSEVLAKILRETKYEEMLRLDGDEDGVAGESGTRYPSRFLLEMDMGGLDVARGISEDFLEAAKAYIANIDRDRDFLSDESLGLVKKAPSAEFAEGDRVVHKIFGVGIVKAVNEKNFCYEIAFEKFATPRSIQFDFPLTRI